MDDNINNIVRQATIETLGEMAFIDAIETEDDVSSIRDPICVGIKLLMPFYGDLYIICPKNLAIHLVKNVFPAESDNNPSLVNDAILEFCNIVAGKIFQIKFPEILFELGIPEICSHADRALNCPLHKKIFLKTFQQEILCVAHKITS
ncbi:MAG: chemotaxis protein CheX [Oligoflexales bacterium]|nr:chemotaxis protein CheX [Oligoflexales bacterium]